MDRSSLVLSKTQQNVLNVWYDLDRSDFSELVLRLRPLPENENYQTHPNISYLLFPWVMARRYANFNLRIDASLLQPYEPRTRGSSLACFGSAHYEAHDDEQSKEELEEIFTLMHWMVAVFCTRVMRTLFLALWEKNGDPWVDGASSGGAYWNRETKVVKDRLMKPTKAALMNGDSTLWDFTALAFMLLQSSVHPVDDPEDRNYIEDFRAFRNELSHAKPSNLQAFLQLTLKFGVCLTSVRRFTRKHAPGLEATLEARVKRLEDKQYYLKHPHELSQLLAELLSHLRGPGAHLNRFSSFGPTANAAVPEEGFHLDIQNFDFALPVVSRDHADTASIVSVAANCSEGSTQDCSLSDRSTLSANSDDDSDVDGQEVNAAVHNSRPVRACSPSMQLLEAFIMRTLSEDCLAIFQATKGCIRCQEEMSQLVNELVASGDLEPQVASAESTNRTPAHSILSEIVLTALETPKKKRFWAAITRYMTCEMEFLEVVNRCADEGLFSVQQAMETESHVAFLSMSKFSAWVISLVLNKYPEVRHAMFEAGINVVIFGFNGPDPIWLGHAVPLRRTALSMVVGSRLISHGTLKLFTLFDREIELREQIAKIEWVHELQGLPLTKSVSASLQQVKGLLKDLEAVKMTKLSPFFADEPLATACNRLTVIYEDLAFAALPEVDWVGSQRRRMWLESELAAGQLTRNRLILELHNSGSQFLTRKSASHANELLTLEESIRKLEGDLSRLENVQNELNQLLVSAAGKDHGGAHGDRRRGAKTNSTASARVSPSFRENTDDRPRLDLEADWLVETVSLRSAVTALQSELQNCQLPSLRAEVVGLRNELRERAKSALAVPQDISGESQVMSRRQEKRVMTDFRESEPNLTASKNSSDGTPTHHESIVRSSPAASIQRDVAPTAEYRSGQSEPQSLLASLRGQIALGLRSRTDEFIEDVFDLHADKVTKSILKRNLPSILRSFVVADNEDEDDLVVPVLTLDTDHIDLEEFKRIIRTPGPLDEWAASVPLSQLLADAIPRKHKTQPLRVVSSLSEVEIDTISEAFTDGFKQLLRTCSSKLRNAFKVMDERAEVVSNNAAAKFEVFALRCGTIEDFHKGLGGRVGAPHLEFFKAMEAEHCRKAGCHHEFTTVNYGITTTPHNEWTVVNCCDCSKADMRFNRQIPRISELLKCPLAQLAKLLDHEMVAIVLYTGPMFMIYNSILRRWPYDLFDIFDKGGNLYPTTIHVLVSAVQKIACVMKLPEGLVLYRGLGGTTTLPDHFFKADSNGCRGYAEWGFMSTTSNKSVALQYSGIQEGKPLALLFEISVSAVDRGACIRDFSQYPGEVEFLWVPCSFLEPFGSKYLEVTGAGLVEVIPVRVNANLKTFTVEDLVNQKRQMHLNSFKYLLDEVKRDLESIAIKQHAAERWVADKTTDNDTEFTLAGFVRKIFDQCEEVYKRHEGCSPHDYARSEIFRALVIEMLEVKTMAISKLDWWLSDTSQFLSYVFGWPLRTTHRGRICFLRRTLSKAADCQQAALTLSQVMGLVQNSVDEMNDLGEVKILSAAADGVSAQDLRLLVQAGSDVHSVDRDGNTALLKAASAGHEHLIKELHSLGADINHVNRDGDSAVMLAAAEGHEKCIELLGSMRADVNIRADKGITAIFVAAQNGHADCIVALVRLGAEVNLKNTRGMCPLHCAAYQGHADCISALYEAGADLEIQDRGGMTAAMLAQYYNTLDCLRLLQRLGAELDTICLNALANKFIGFSEDPYKPKRDGMVPFSGMDSGFCKLPASPTQQDPATAAEVAELITTDLPTFPSTSTVASCSPMDGIVGATALSAEVGEKVGNDTLQRS